MNFAVLGVAGFVAPRHLEAIRIVGGNITAAIDPVDSVGRLDSYGLDIRYSRDTNLYSAGLLCDVPFDWLSICTPNYLHFSQCLFGLNLGASVICEKPLVIYPGDLDTLTKKEQETGKRVYTVLQLRYHPAVLAIKDQLASHHTVKVAYHTPRGNWYRQSWKGDKTKSGGLLFNIGIHLFDLLLWLFGPVESYEVTKHSPETSTGVLHLERALVDWSLSVSPQHPKKREIIIDGLRLNLTETFDNLHTEVYRQILSGNGYGIQDARGAVELCYHLSQ